MTERPLYNIASDVQSQRSPQFWRHKKKKDDFLARLIIVHECKAESFRHNKIHHQNMPI